MHDGMASFCINVHRGMLASTAAGGGPAYWELHEQQQIDYLKSKKCTQLGMDQEMYAMMDEHLAKDPVVNPIGVKHLGSQVILHVLVCFTCMFVCKEQHNLECRLHAI